MRKPATIERLYLDFDGFFASVMQQAMAALRGRPVSVAPFENAGDSTVVIACSKEAKAAACLNVRFARSVNPDHKVVQRRRIGSRLAEQVGISNKLLIYTERPET